MSLIHEALKKAETQRRLGKPPTLGSPFAVTRRRHRLLPLLLATIVIAAGTGWWLLHIPTEPSTLLPTSATSRPSPYRVAAEGPDVAKQVGTSTATITNELAPPKATALARTTEARPEASLPAERESPPHLPDTNLLAVGESPKIQPSKQPPGTTGNQATVAQRVETKLANAMQSTQLPRTQDVTAAKESIKSSANTSTTTATTIKGPDTQTASPEPFVDLSSPSGAVTTRAATTSSNVLPTADGATTEKTAVATITKSAPDLPFFWQLPYNVRKDLPDFTLSMHVFSSDPQSRFVILNGNRQIEGDTLGTDVNLREIRSDGVVLEFHGQRFLVPRVGS